MWRWLRHKSGNGLVAGNGRAHGDGVAARTGVHGLDPACVVVTDSRSPAAEAFRVIRTNLEFAAPDVGVRVLVVSSPLAAEGKSTTAANLALAVAQAGRRVLCVDADLRRPSLHRLFNVPSTPGLSSILVGRATVEQARRVVASAPALELLPAGPLPPNPSELLGSARFTEFLAAARAAYDLVLLDVPPVLGMADAPLAARHADGVVLVVRAGFTRREALRGAVEALRRADAHVVGVVLNGVRGGAGYYYRYTYTRSRDRSRPFELDAPATAVTDGTGVAQKEAAT